MVERITQVGDDNGKRGERVKSNEGKKKNTGRRESKGEGSQEKLSTPLHPSLSHFFFFSLFLSLSLSFLGCFSFVLLLRCHHD